MRYKYVSSQEDLFKLFIKYHKYLYYKFIFKIIYNYFYASFVSDMLKMHNAMQIYRLNIRYDLPKII